ncbi:MAG: hypothetical protein K2X99_00700 [Gemmatimonadaceae bacterium]|nr:hypothetical protein [Gemmatimonadaceae bacterium]
MVAAFTAVILDQIRFIQLPPTWLDDGSRTHRLLAALGLGFGFFVLARFAWGRPKRPTAPSNARERTEAFLMGSQMESMVLAALLGAAVAVVGRAERISTVANCFMFLAVALGRRPSR